MTELLFSDISPGVIKQYLLGVTPQMGKIQILLEVTSKEIDGEEDTEVHVSAFGAAEPVETPDLTADVFEYVTKMLRDPEFQEAWKKQISDRA